MSEPIATAPKSVPVAPVPPRVDRVEGWARIKKTSPVMFKAAAAGARWQHGESFDPCLVTEAEYDAAVAFAENPYASVNPR